MFYDAGNAATSEKLPNMEDDAWDPSWKGNTMTMSTLTKRVRCVSMTEVLPLGLPCKALTKGKVASRSTLRALTKQLTL